MNNAGQGVILLVEDDPNDVELVLRMFKKYNLANRVAVIGDGAEALEYIFAKGKYANGESCDQPRVIFLDLKLPRLSGIDILRVIKSDERTRMIPVVVFSSSSEDPDMKECYDLGVNSYIVKSSDPGKFSENAFELGIYWLQLNRSPAKEAVMGAH